jgi:outer membrane immunogenic protein
MKRMLIAGALALCATGQVLAADLPPAPPPPPRAPAAYVPLVEPPYNWGGFYVGVNGGWGLGSTYWNSTVPATSTGTFSVNGGMVGGTVGANFQSGPFVFGIETDIDWSDIHGDTTAANPACPACETANSWLGTVRGRAGYAFNRVLVFATAGGAYGDVKATPAGGAATDTTEFGWTAGGGIEVAITGNWTVKVEYLYVDLGSGSCSAGCGGGAPLITALGSPASVKLQTTNLIRAGLNFKFGGF